MLERLPDLSGYMKICQDIIFPQIIDTDFEGLYKEGGRPPVSPRVLMCVTILQFLEKIPDRAAARNIVYRLDWKIALGLEVDDPGFSYQLLSVWRTRIVENDSAKRVFDDLVELLKEKGLVKKNGKQRIDSTHVLADLRELSRVELMTETLRLACLDLLKLKVILPDSIAKIINTYHEGINLYQLGSTERSRILGQAGIDMLNLVEFSKVGLLDGEDSKNIQTLITVFEQNFTVDEKSVVPKLIKVATGKDHICSPHDTEARYGSKHKKIGYKAQIVETAERDQGNFIIDVIEEDNEQTDHGKLEEALERLVEKNLAPGTVYADAGYISGKTMNKTEEEDITVLGPIENRSREFSDDFQYDQYEDQYTCPEGKTSNSVLEESDGSKIYRFSASDCSSCPLKAQCRPKAKEGSRDGRIVRRSKYHNEISERRELMKTETYKEAMKNRNAIEGTISALKRGAGLARCKFKGKANFRTQLFFSAIAFNIKRLDAWV